MILRALSATTLDFTTIMLSMRTSWAGDAGRLFNIPLLGVLLNEITYKNRICCWIFFKAHGMSIDEWGEAVRVSSTWPSVMLTTGKSGLGSFRISEEHWLDFRCSIGFLFFRIIFSVISAEMWVIFSKYTSSDSESWETSRELLAQPIASWDWLPGWTLSWQQR